MNLLDRWRKWNKRQADINSWRQRVLYELRERDKVGSELLAAIEAGDLNLVIEIQAKLDSLPCPTCGRNGGDRVDII